MIPVERIAFLALAGLMIVAGLCLRLPPWGLPLAIHHLGGGLLWGAMVYALIGAFRPIQWTRSICLLAALTVICIVEGSRLVHTPASDHFRSTLPGQVLLGHIFSPWNMIVDGIGAVAVALGTGHLLR